MYLVYVCGVCSRVFVCENSTLSRGVSAPCSYTHKSTGKAAVSNYYFIHLSATTVPRALVLRLKITFLCLRMYFTIFPLCFAAQAPNCWVPLVWYVGDWDAFVVFGSRFLLRVYVFVLIIFLLIIFLHACCNSKFVFCSGVSLHSQHLLRYRRVL